MDYRFRLTKNELIAFHSLVRAPKTLSELAENLGWSEPNASATISAMAERGFVNPVKRNEKTRPSYYEHASKLFFLAQKHDLKTFLLLAGDALEIVLVVRNLSRANGDYKHVPLNDILAWTGFSQPNSKRKIDPLHELGWLLFENGYRIGNPWLEDFVHFYQEYLVSRIALDNKATSAFAFANQAFIQTEYNPGHAFQPAGMAVLEQLGANILPGPDYWVASIGKKPLPKPCIEEQVIRALAIGRVQPGQKYMEYAALAIHANKRKMRPSKLRESAEKYRVTKELKDTENTILGIEYAKDAG